jgi:uncharacterized protein YecE (DUF72 family)
VEFRYASWWNQEVYDAFKVNNIIFCRVNHPELPDDIIVTAPYMYSRLHGNPQLFYSPYSEEFLIHLYRQIIQKKSINETFIYFNNTASSAGILNAQQFKLFV